MSIKNALTLNDFKRTIESLPDSQFVNKIKIIGFLSDIKCIAERYFDWKICYEKITTNEIQSIKPTKIMGLPET